MALRLGLGDSVPSDFSYTPCSVMSMSKGGLVLQLGWELVRLAARDRTDAAIAKPETPFVRVDELGGQISGNAWRALHGTKPASSARSASAASSSAPAGPLAVRSRGSETESTDRRRRHFVASMPAPVASGWSGCRVGLAPTGKRRLVTAHTQLRRCGQHGAIASAAIKNCLSQLYDRHNSGRTASRDAETG